MLPRLRLKGLERWGAVLAIYTLYIALNRPEVNGRAASWLSGYGTPFAVFTAIAWLSPLPWRARKGRPWPSLGYGLLRSVLASATALSAMVLMDAALRRMAGQATNLLGALMVNLLLLAPIAVVMGRVLSLREKEAAEKRETQARLEEAQGRLLQNQMHPHVLFNALNGLAELVRKDPASGEACIESLSALMRKLVDLSESTTVSLGEERSLVEDYLAVELMRLGPRLTIRWDWDADLEGLRVQPLLLQPLAENAIKHGIAPCAEGGELGILARREGEGVLLQVCNTGKPLQEPPPDGVGTRNLRQRLALAYGSHALFSLSAEGSRTVARIHLGFEALR